MLEQLKRQIQYVIQATEVQMWRACGLPIAIYLANNNDYSKNKVKLGVPVVLVSRYVASVIL